MISVLLPTRNRFDLCKASIQSLYDKAMDAASFEVLLGTDVDDTAPYSTLPGRVFQFERRGYGKLNEYYNVLAEQAEGDWLFVWNDDAEMLADGWDGCINRYEGQFLLLAPIPLRIRKGLVFKHRHRKRHKTLFPIFPRTWLDVVGRIGGNPIDSWVELVAPEVGIWEWLDLDILQNRPDDDTTNNRSTGLPFASEEAGKERAMDVNRLRKYLRRTNVAGN